MDQGWPENLREWETYVQRLPDSKVTDKAYAVNGIQFVEMLQEDGYSADEIETILYFFARRLHECETAYVPADGDFYISYQRLLRERGDL